MIKMNISVDNDILQQFQMALAKFGEGRFPLTAHAMNIEAERIAEQWRDFANGGELKGIKPLTRPNRSYLFGVKVRQLGPFDYEIFNESKAARRIEEGTPELDMKTTHPYGPKSRVSKKGVPYLIVPFRWGTPGDERNPRVGFRNIMPDQVYNIVQNYTKMKTLVGADRSDRQTMNAHRMLPNGRASKNGAPHEEMVGRAQYNKGYDRLSGMDFSGTVQEKTRMNGMVRVDAKGKSAKEYGNYLTFRVISAESPSESWISPRVDPRPVVQTLADQARGSINATVEAAIKGDLHDILSE
jgi:hypothetical protein